MVKKYGEIDPQLLHNAITSTATPPLTSAESTFLRQIRMRKLISKKIDP